MARRKPKVGDWVWVVWHDSRGVSSSWEFTKDALAHRNVNEFCRCLSAGKLIVMNDTVVTIAPHVADDGEQIIGTMIIPRVAVKRLTRIVEAK